MKILQVNICLNVLSTGRITEQIGETIINEGWDSYVLTYGPLKESRSHVIKSDGGIEHFMHRVINRFCDCQGYGSYFATKKVIKRIETINPDIIHLQNIHDCWLNFPQLFDYIIKNKKPVVWTFHDCWAFTGHCAYFDDADCLRWQKLCYDCPLKREFSLDLSQFNYKKKKSLFSVVPNMTIVPVSRWLEDIAKQSFLGGKRIITIHNGVDLDMFKPRQTDLRKKLNISDNFVLLGVASNWGKSKGIFDFISLSENTNYTIVLIGIPDKMKELLPANIIVISKTDSQEQLSEYYSMADVFVNPTYHDNFPTVNLEALACGTPIVGYRTGGSPEAVEEGANDNLEKELCGEFVEQGDLSALINVIEKIRNERKEVRLKRKDACRKRAVAMFDKKDCYRKYIEIYRTVINQNE